MSDLEIGAHRETLGVPSRPCKRDDLLDVIEGASADVFPMKTNMYIGGERADLTSILDVAAHGEWFDFGDLSEDTLDNASADSLPFIEAGLTDLPFPLTVFRYRSLAIGDRQLESVIALSQPEPGDPITLRHLLFLGNDHYTNLLVLAEAVIHGGGIVDHCTANDEIAGSYAFASVAAHNAMALWLILNTKGLRRTVIEPSVKLNKIRRKNGKRSLLRVTKIDTRQYDTALTETRHRESTRVSSGTKRMHLRRAHLRYYEDKPKPVGVSACIVNGYDDGPLREGYKVVT